MRWDRLFDDLEAQLDADAVASLVAEVADRTRRERALVELADRLVAHAGRRVRVHLAGRAAYEGVLAEVAQQWFVLSGPVLVPLAAVTGIDGLGAAAVTGGRTGVRRRASLASALRAVARDRSPVRLDLVDGYVLTGTMDAVGADYVDLAQHGWEQQRRAEEVLGVRAVPFAALVAVRPAPGTSSLA